MNSLITLNERFSGIVNTAHDCLSRLAENFVGRQERRGSLKDSLLIEYGLASV